jgi:hypothetical protein
MHSFRSIFLYDYKLLLIFNQCINELRLLIKDVWNSYAQVSVTSKGLLQNNHSSVQHTFVMVISYKNIFLAPTLYNVLVFASDNIWLLCKNNFNSISKILRFILNCFTLLSTTKWAFGKRFQAIPSRKNTLLETNQHFII